MAYHPLRGPADLATRLIPGVTREDDFLELKRERHIGGDAARECARDAAQFANASGGSLILGADELAHVFQGYVSVPVPDDVVLWVTQAVGGNLSPVPVVEPQIIDIQGASVVAINVPPSVPLIAVRIDQRYEFPVRAGVGKRYMPVAEVEARMGNHERAMRIRLEAVAASDPVILDHKASLPTDSWHVNSVNDHSVTVSRDSIALDIPLAYVEAVYRTTEPGAVWTVAVDCVIQDLGTHRRVRRNRTSG